MLYAIVPLAPVDRIQVASYFGTLVGNGLRVMYDGYAPHMWIVSYNGTPRQLTDLVWPDDTPKNDRLIPAGVVFRTVRGNYNGFAAGEMWELLRGKGDGPA